MLFHIYYQRINIAKTATYLVSIDSLAETTSMLLYDASIEIIRSGFFASGSGRLRKLFSVTFKIF